MADVRNPYPARWPIGERAPVLDFPVDAAATWDSNALVILDAQGELAEAGADPAAVAGIATGPWPQFLPGHVQGGSLNPGFLGGQPRLEIYLASGKTVFSWPVLNGIAVPPTAANVGILYGVVKDTDDIWKIDTTETTATVVKIVGLDPVSPNRAFAEFAGAAILQV